ncbi:MAG: hypothetical protein DRJ11_04475 [Candidatus Aminicenantes bacterium]|nr:MAG: hypothetical protein DRJ11_04475 [Candidatus Aminicenantes bacterium]
MDLLKLRHIIRPEVSNSGGKKFTSPLDQKERQPFPRNILFLLSSSKDDLIFELKFLHKRGF